MFPCNLAVVVCHFLFEKDLNLFAIGKKMAKYMIPILIRIFGKFIENTLTYSIDTRNAINTNENSEAEVDTLFTLYKGFKMRYHFLM